MNRPRVLTIAGSDSGGGAGIQADIKTFAALGAFGVSAITAVTAQNTLGVKDVHRVSAQSVREQIDAVVDDIGVDAAKTGMLWDAEIIGVAADSVREHNLKNLVVDPVMVATSGDRLLEPDAEKAMVRDLLPLASLITPNVREAEALCGRTLDSIDRVQWAAACIAEELGGGAAVVTGGLPGGPATDIVYADGALEVLSVPRVETTSTHGTGCTFSSAAAVGLARGLSVVEAVATAKDFVTGAIQAAYPVGSGRGPVDHFFGIGVNLPSHPKEFT